MFQGEPLVDFLLSLCELRDFRKNLNDHRKAVYMLSFEEDEQGGCYGKVGYRCFD